MNLKKKIIKAQAKNRDYHGVPLKDAQVAALLYAQRKVADPDGERDPLTRLEADAVEFLLAEAEDKRIVEGN